MGTQLEPDVWYRWSSGDSLCCIVPQTDGRYIRTATNSCGTATDIFELRATSCDSCVIFPNAFSPNGDGINDAFRAIEACPVKDFQLHLYDRWGKRVFETDDKDGRWDGRLKGTDAPIGTYMYYATFTTILSDKKHIVKGSVILFR
jgi:gliding motility-associated-like protein